VLPLQKPLIIPIFIPHSGCPHRCVFCNQSIITDTKQKLPGRKEIKKITDKYLQFKGRRDLVQLAFFGGNFLGLDTSYIIELLNITRELKQASKIDSVRFSTRPDTISEARLDLIKKFPVSCIELGVQSMNDKVLLLSNRGHSSRCTIDAASLLKKYEYETGMQIMVGLPGEDKKSTLKGAMDILCLKPDFIRIYPLVVIRGSLIADWYESGRYTPLKLDQAITIVKKIYTMFKNKNIPVIRMGLQTSEILESTGNILAGPWHPAFGHLVLSELFFDKAETKIKNLLSKGFNGNAIALKVHPSSDSRLRGYKNNNLKKLNQIFPGITFSIKGDILMGKESLKADFFH